VKAPRLFLFVNLYESTIFPLPFSIDPTKIDFVVLFGVILSVFNRPAILIDIPTGLARVIALVFKIVESLIKSFTWINFKLVF
jgi:hypothetical protein